MLKDWRTELELVKPETVILWRKRSLREFWRERSQSRIGRPSIPRKHIYFIQRISSDNPEYGESRIALELELKFGIRHSSASSIGTKWSELKARGTIAQTSAGEYVTGSVRTDPENANQVLVKGDAQVLPVEQLELVYLKHIDAGVWGRLSASVDFGLSLTKANDTRQMNARITGGYLAEKWSANGTRGRNQGTGSFFSCLSVAFRGNMGLAIPADLLALLK
jgi:hypothetical protein